MLSTMLPRVIGDDAGGVMSDKQSNGAGRNQTTGATVCRARRLGASNLVECQTEIPSCHWHIPFGEGRLCGHISNQIIAMGVLPNGWLTDVSENS